MFYIFVHFVMKTAVSCTKPSKKCLSHKNVSRNGRDGRFFVRKALSTTILRKKPLFSSRNVQKYKIFSNIQTTSPASNLGFCPCMCETL